LFDCDCVVHYKILIPRWADNPALSLASAQAEKSLAARNFICFRHVRPNQLKIALHDFCPEV
jgi:hypothetical protein